MERDFGKSGVSCLELAVQEIQNSELTQELKLPDGMPDIGHILCVWGQVILRGKEWRGDSISCSGGMMVWVLYEPEDGGEDRCIDGWIPFHDGWDLPDGLPDGEIIVRYLPRFMDGRSVSPRKIMVRAGVSAMVCAYVAKTAEVYVPDGDIEGVELLRTTYPVWLRKEAGEKTFLQDEELKLPEGDSQPQAIISYRILPKITDRKVLSDKAVFRGNTCLHLIYRCSEGKLHYWDTEIPFSQYLDLKDTHGTEAQVEFALCPTNLELELDSGGQMRLKCGLAAQYLITEKENVALVEDAYSPGRELEVHGEDLHLPVVLDRRAEDISAEQQVTKESGMVVDAQLLADFPKQYRSEKGIGLRLPGSFHVLYYGDDGGLRSASVRWEGECMLAADENSRISAIPMPGKVLVLTNSAGMLAKAEVSLEISTSTDQEFGMVSGLDMVQSQKLDPGRPSLILCRADEKSLWELAKYNGSTVEAIRQANGLQEEPAPGRMLLIPVL